MKGRSPATGFGQSRSLAPAYQVHEMLGRSISSPCGAAGRNETFKLEIDESLLPRETPQRPAESRSVTERLNEAYDEKAEREDEEFLKNVKKYHRRRFSED